MDGDRQRERQSDKQTEWGCSLKISVMIFAIGLQDDGDDRHDGLDNAELQRRLERRHHNSGGDKANKQGHWW